MIITNTSVWFDGAIDLDEVKAQVSEELKALTLAWHKANSKDAQTISRLISRNWDLLQQLNEATANVLVLESEDE